MASTIIHKNDISNYQFKLEYWYSIKFLLGDKPNDRTLYAIHKNSNGSLVCLTKYTDESVSRGTIYRNMGTIPDAQAQLQRVLTLPLDEDYTVLETTMITKQELQILQHQATQDKQG